MCQRNIVLVGFMGTGKSTIGKLLASRLRWDYLDTDQLIVEKAGSSIPEIFDKSGESGFRQLESEVIELALQGERQVISTGGGAALAKHNREIMLERSLVIELQASVKEIIARVGQDPNRPLLRGDAEQQIRTLMKQREGIYSFSHYHLDTTNKTLDDLVAQIISWTDSLPSLHTFD